MQVCLCSTVIYFLLVIVVQTVSLQVVLTLLLHLENIVLVFNIVDFCIICMLILPLHILDNYFCFVQNTAV